MQDGIIKGTGNSRYLKSISNFLQQYPTYQDFVAALVAGTLPIDLNGINETGWDQLGTALNKANLLSDETVTAYGSSLPENPVPDDVLSVLSKALLYQNGGVANPAGEVLDVPGLAFVTGTYTGNSSQVYNNVDFQNGTIGYRSINLGFQPSAVFVSIFYISNAVATVSMSSDYFGFRSPSASAPGLTVTSTGFNVSNYYSSSNVPTGTSRLNYTGYRYVYIAFK